MVHIVPCTLYSHCTFIDVSHKGISFFSLIDFCVHSSYRKFWRHFFLLLFWSAIYLTAYIHDTRSANQSAFSFCLLSPTPTTTPHLSYKDVQNQCDIHFVLVASSFFSSFFSILQLASLDRNLVCWLYVCLRAACLPQHMYYRNLPVCVGVERIAFLTLYHLWVWLNGYTLVLYISCAVQFGQCRMYRNWSCFSLVSPFLRPVVHKLHNLLTLLHIVHFLVKDRAYYVCDFKIKKIIFTFWKMWIGLDYLIPNIVSDIRSF